MLSVAKKKVTAICALLLMALLTVMLMSCGSEAEPEDEVKKDVVKEEPAVQDTSEPAANPSDEKAVPRESAQQDMNDPGSNPPPAAEIVMTELDEGAVSELGNHNLFVDPASEGQDTPLYLLISTDYPVTDVKFMDISMVDAPEPTYSITSVLYEQQELASHTPLLVKTMFPGDMPSKGFAFTLGSGQKVNLYITHSGEDGSLIYKPFNVA